MNNKFNMWTINYINNKGVHTFIECQDRIEVSLILADLKMDKQNMDYINIFPPNSNITYDELLNYK